MCLGLVFVCIPLPEAQQDTASFTTQRVAAWCSNGFQLWKYFKTSLEQDEHGFCMVLIDNWMAWMGCIWFYDIWTYLNMMLIDNLLKSAMHLAISCQFISMFFMRCQKRQRRWLHCALPWRTFAQWPRIQRRTGPGQGLNCQDTGHTTWIKDGIKCFAAIIPT